MQIHRETKYYKYQYADWTQPAFTSETTWGKVWADNNYSGQYPWHALDGNTSGGNEADFASSSSSEVNWYWNFKSQLKISKIKIWNRNNAGSYGGSETYTIYGKNRNETYEQIGTLSLAATAWVSGTVTITSTKLYYGLKINCKGSKSYAGIGEVLLTAQTLSKKVESTSSDYDEMTYVYKAKRDTVTKYYKYADWTQPVLTSNLSSTTMWLEDPKKSGATNSSDQANIETWGTSAMKKFDNVYYAMDSNTTNVFTLGSSNVTQATYTEQTYDVCDVCFSQNLKITHIKVVCKFQSGYHCALRRVIAYAIESDGTVGKRLFNKTGSNDTTTLEADVGTNKTRRVRFCFRPDWNNGSYSCQIQEISITAQKPTSGTSSDYDYTETPYQYKVYNS